MLKIVIQNIEEGTSFSIRNTWRKQIAMLLKKEDLDYPSNFKVIEVVKDKTNLRYICESIPLRMPSPLQSPGRSFMKELQDENTQRQKASAKAPAVLRIIFSLMFFFISIPKIFICISFVSAFSE